jgi:hypothetical protein
MGGASACQSGERTTRGAASLIRQCGSTHEARLAWHFLATFAYLVERQDSAAARAFVADLLAWAKVAATTHAHALLAMPQAKCNIAMNVSGSFSQQRTNPAEAIRPVVRSTIPRRALKPAICLILLARPCAMGRM